MKTLKDFQTLIGYTLIAISIFLAITIASDRIGNAYESLGADIQSAGNSVGAGVSSAGNLIRDGLATDTPAENTDLLSWTDALAYTGLSDGAFQSLFDSGALDGTYVVVSGEYSDQYIFIRELLYQWCIDRATGE